MHKVNLLLGRGSPRGYIEAVEEQNEHLPCDKIIPRHITEWKAYRDMRAFFLLHPEYTHLVLATDDIVVKPSHVMQLQYDLEKEDHPVLSGLMNVDLDDNVWVNISMGMPMKNRKLRRYYWMNWRDIFVKDNIFEVAFSGFPLMAIRRDIVEAIPFDADKVFEGEARDRGASLDFVFCWYLQDRGIPIMVDKRINMLHLRTKGGLVFENARLEFWPKGGDIQTIDREAMLEEWSKLNKI